MSQSFLEVEPAVKQYFRECLDAGEDLAAVVDRFRGDVPLPTALAGTQFEPATVKRVGQIVGTRLLIKQNKERSAVIPNHDMLRTGL